MLWFKTEGNGSLGCFSALDGWSVIALGLSDVHRLVSTDVANTGRQEKTRGQWFTLEQQQGYSVVLCTSSTWWALCHLKVGRMYPNKTALSEETKTMPGIWGRIKQDPESTRLSCDTQQLLWAAQTSFLMATSTSTAHMGTQHTHRGHAKICEWSSPVKSSLFITDHLPVALGLVLSAGAFPHFPSPLTLLLE